ncbi:MAG: hypothetical protein ACR2HF_01540 [Methylococcaceae bacterium]
MEKLLDGAVVEWKALGEIFDISAGGDAPKVALSESCQMGQGINFYMGGLIKPSLKTRPDNIFVPTQELVMRKSNMSIVGMCYLVFQKPEIKNV